MHYPLSIVHNQLRYHTRMYRSRKMLKTQALTNLDLVLRETVAGLDALSRAPRKAQ